ncbi:MAG: DUF1835 domain-containing protein [Flavobacteriaceae bacterium]|nr:DUF1835 domain-containing protein [Flavobacteriaceae bacterium]
MEIHIIEEENTALPFLKNTYNKVVVFKESFNEGEIDKNIGSDNFWKKRYAHFENKGISKLDYFDNTIKPLTILQNIPQNATVYFWFSEDEKSQFNRIVVLTYLLEYYRKDISYYSVLVVDNKPFEDCLNDKKRLSRNRLLEACSELRVENG